MNTFNLTLDLDKEQGLPQLVTLRQGDKSGTQLVATIYDHGQLVSGGYTARVSLRHPGSGDTYYRETATYSNGVATVTIDEQYAATVAGVTTGYFELLQGSTVKASTADFIVRILPSAEDGAVPGEVYDSAIEDALDELDAATGRISQMVVDATAEYLAAHPEITTTVQDNSVTDAKLIQSGGVLDRVGRLWWRLENLLTATPAEAESVTVSDAAKTPVAGLTVFGKSTQDGTPTPDAPVAIQSVTPNLYRQTLYAAGATHSTAGITITHNEDGTCTCSGTSTANAWLWGGGNSANERLYVTLPAGTYTVCGSHRVAAQKMVNGSVSTLAVLTAGSATFTLDEPTLVKAVPVIPSGITVENETVWVAVYEGDTWQPYVPYANVGLRAGGRNLLDTTAKVMRATNTNGSWSDNAWTLNGVTFTVNPFGSITVNGTASGLTTMLLTRNGFALPAGTYVLNGCPSGGSDSTYRIDIYAVSDVALAVDYGSGAQFTLTERTVISYMRIRVPSGASLSNKTFYPMIRPASLSPQFQPYTESVTALPVDGHTLRSLPDGTRDEVTVDQYGHVTLVQRVGHIELDGSSDEDWQALNKSFGGAAPNVKIAQTSAQVIQTRSNRFVPISADATWIGSSVGVGIANTTSRPIRIHNGDMTLAEWTAWLAANPVTVDYPLATPQTHDLGTIDPTALVGPDLTAQAVPTAPFALTYERDLNATLARLEAALATLA